MTGNRHSHLHSQGLRNVDVCLHDVALERQLIDARNDDNISRRLRQAADLAAVQRIQSDESAAVLITTPANRTPAPDSALRFAPP